MPDHRDVDQLLDDMNDVITDWEGSEDAAQWSAEQGWTDPDYDPDLDALGLVEAGQRAADAVGRVRDALVEWFQTPDFRMLVELARQLQAHPGASPQEVNEIGRRVLGARQVLEGERRWLNPTRSRFTSIRHHGQQWAAGSFRSRSPRSRSTAV